MNFGICFHLIESMLKCNSKVEYDEKFGRYYGVFFSLVDTFVNNLLKKWIPKPGIFIIKCFILQFRKSTLKMSIKT